MTSNNPANKEEVNDQELEDLLDSAIEDFDKPAKSVKEKVPETQKHGEDDVWSEEFLVEVQKNFEKNMKSLFNQDSLEDKDSFVVEQFEEQMQRMASNAKKVLNEHPETSETIAQTLKNMSENTENLDSELGVNDLRTMMEGLELGSPDLATNMLPLMQFVMQSFLSKEILYGPIKEITEKYPSWLKEHKSSISETDYENYVKQFHLMEEVCKEFDDENDADREEIKYERFKKIFSLMDEMQKLGQPPKDLVGEGVPFGFDESMMNQLPGFDQSMCSIM